MAKAEFSAPKLINQITVNVRVRRMNEARARLWLGLLFVRLGVWITGMRCEVTPWK